MSNDLATKSIRFPTHCYVGFDPRPNPQDDFPLGFMTEDGTDKAAEKRKKTVDNWSKTSKPRTLDNVPMVGFRLSRSIRRNSGWGSGNVKWRIEDPRGFELEISSPNLAQIIATCVIDDGVIVNECMWARLGGENVLVPTHSDLYRTTKENSERMKKSVPMSSVKIGNRIVLQNGVEGIYLGKMFEVSTPWGNENQIPEIPDRTRMVVLSSYQNPHTDEVAPHMRDFASMKVAEILDTAEMTVREAEALANEHARWLANRVEIPAFKLVPARDDRPGMKVAQIPEFDDEWCVVSTHPSRTQIIALDKDLLDQGIYGAVQWYPIRELMDQYKPRGFDIIINYWRSGEKAAKSAYTTLDLSAYPLFQMVRTFTTPAGNTLEWTV